MIIIYKVTMLGEKPALKMMLLLLSITSAWTTEEVDAIIIPHKLHVEESDYVQFKCLTTTDAHDVFWTTALDTPLLGHVVTIGSILVIREASIRDTGKYICHTNSHRGQYQTSAYLIVTDTTTASVTPRELIVEHGDVAELKCRGTGDKYKLYWTLKNDQIMPTHVKLTGSSLRIFSVTERDNCTYICSVISTTGTTNASAKIIVKEKTTALIVPKTLELEEGQVANFSCNVTGDDPQIYWHADSDSKFSPVVISGNDSILKIINTSAGDYVKIYCKVVTSTGKAESTASFIVREKTTAEIVPKEKLAKLGDRVKFYCIGSGHNYNITWMRGSQKPLPPHIKFRGSVLEIPNVTLNDSSEYVCQIRSRTGISNTKASLTVKGALSKQDHTFNLHNVQYQSGATSDETHTFVAPNDSYPIYIRLLVVSSGFIACVFAFLFGYLLYSKCRKKKVKIIAMESMGNIRTLLRSRKFYKSSRIRRISRNRVHPTVVSDCSIVKLPNSIPPPYRTNSAPPALQPARKTSDIPNTWHQSQRKSSSILSQTTASPGPNVTIPEVLNPDWSARLCNSSSGSDCTTTKCFNLPKSPEPRNLPNRITSELIELPGTATRYTPGHTKLDVFTSTNKSDTIPGRFLNTLQIDEPSKKSRKLDSPKTKYGYIGFGPTGIYRGIFEVHSATQFVPSLSALAMEKVKTSSITNTPSGLSFVPSTVNHSSMLEKRGQLEFVPSQKLSSSTSVPSVAVYSSGSDLKKSNSSVNLTTRKPIAVKLVEKEVGRKRKVGFYDQYILGRENSDTAKCIHTDIRRKGLLPNNSSLAKRVKGNYNY